jgi:hypothetical protein
MTVSKKRGNCVWFPVFNTESAIPCPLKKSDVHHPEINLFFLIGIAPNELQYRDVN